MQQIGQIISWIKQQAFPEGNHKFYIQSEPNHVQANSIISIKCFTNKQKQRIVGCRYLWSRVQNGLITPLGYIKGNVYQCNPQDVGSTINVEVISLQPDFPGTAVLNFGPVRVDMMTRIDLQKLISKKQAKYSVIACSLNQQKQILVKITDNSIRFKSSHNQQLSFKTNYSYDNPIIQYHHKDPTRLSLKFSQQNHEASTKFLYKLFENANIKIYKGSIVKFDLKFNSNYLRNQFLFLFKSFVAKQQAKTLAVLSQIENLSITHNEKFDYLLQIQSLKQNIDRFNTVNKQLSSQKQFYCSEVKRLEQQLSLIILTYTKIVEQKFKNQLDLNNSYSILTNKRQQVLIDKTSKLQSINEQYQRKINNLTQEIKKEKTKGRISSSLHVVKKQAPFEQIQYRLHELSQINVKLTKQNQKLKIMNRSHRVQMMNRTDNILDQLKQQQVGEINQLRIANEEMKLLLQIKQKRNKQLETILNKTQILNSEQLQDHKIKNQHKSMIEDSQDYINLSNNFTKLKQQFKKLSELRQYDKANYQIELSKSKFDNSKNDSKMLNFDNVQLEQHNKNLKFENDKLRKQNQNLIQELTKLKQYCKNLHSEQKLLKQGQDILNRSRDFSMEMDNFYSEENNTIKQQNLMLVQQNQRLAKMCQRYLGEAKQANRLRTDVISLRKENSQLKRKIEIDQNLTV